MSYLGNMSASGQYGSDELKQKITSTSSVFDQLDAMIKSYSVSLPGDPQLQQIANYSKSSRQTINSTQVPIPIPSNFPVSDKAWKQLDSLEKQATLYMSQIPQIVQQNTIAPITAPPVFDSNTGMQLAPGVLIPQESNSNLLMLGVIGLLIVGGTMVYLFLNKSDSYPDYLPYPYSPKELERMRRCKKS